MSADLLPSEVADGVLTVTIDRPDKRNALSQDMLASLAALFADHAADEALCLAVLRGSGDKNFAAGGDLVELADVRTPADAKAMAVHSKSALDAIRNFPVPVIAALNGDALGGGSAVAVSCDFRVAAAHARLGFVQGRLNVTSAWGGGIDLMTIVGPTRGLELLAQGRMVGGAEALALGLIDAVADDGEGLDQALARFAEPLKRQKPQVMRAFKALAKGVRAGLPRHQLETLETEMFVDAWVHEDHWAAVNKLLSGWRDK